MISIYLLFTKYNEEMLKVLLFWFDSSGIYLLLSMKRAPELKTETSK